MHNWTNTHYDRGRKFEAREDDDMKASDLLTALQTNVFNNEYEGIFSTYNGKILPFTTIKIGNSDNLVLFRENKKAALSMRDFYLALMGNKSKRLTVWSGSETVPIFGFKMDGNRIVV